MRHIKDKTIVIYIIYNCQIKNVQFFIDIFNFFDIMCNKNDDYIITFNLNMLRISIIYLYHLYNTERFYIN